MFRFGLLAGMLAIAALSAGVAGAAGGDSETFVIAYTCLLYVLSALYCPPDGASPPSGASTACSR